MSELTKIDEERIKEAIAARYHVYPARDVCLYHDYEFVRRGNDKVRREFFYGIIDERCRKPLINYDRIISKSPEEFVDFLADLTESGFKVIQVCIPDGDWHKDCDKTSCKNCWLEWLKSPVEGGET